MRSIQRHEVFTPGRLPIAANEVPALDGIPEHMHEYLELAVVSRGYGLHRTRGNATRLEPGSVILIRPGTWHAYWEPDELWTFNVYLGPDSCTATSPGSCAIRPSRAPCSRARPTWVCSVPSR